MELVVIGLSSVNTEIQNKNDFEPEIGYALADAQIALTLMISHGGIGG